MSIPLLATKLHIPRPRPELVVRPRLVARLNEGLTRKLTLLSTPAGFGKTTLLGEWAAQCQRRLAWLSLDEGDNDPARFVAHLFAALQTIDPSLAGAPGEADLPQIERLTGLINRITALAEPFALVLDDYHLIETDELHRLLAFWLDHLPAQMHLIIASRADPPLPLARLRAQGQLTELRQGDLRFTLAEAAEFLGGLTGAPLGAEAIQTLTARTEGWAAGLQMAAVSMQGRDAEQIRRFIQSFSGGSHFVLDYLAEEVLQRQPPHLQTFLLQTSILDRLSGPLCDAVLKPEGEAATLQPPSAFILDQLEHANLFILPLDDEQRWYRYHQLFADLLRNRLQQTRPELLPLLRRRASVWHEQNGLMADAIAYALAAEDYERAIGLIEPVAEAKVMHSEVDTFLSWMEKLPDHLVRARPALCAYEAWALLINGQPLEAVEARLGSVGGDGSPLASLAAPLRAFIAIYQGQTALAAELSRQALEQLPGQETFLRSLAALTLGAAYISDGQAAAAQPVLDEAARLSHKTGNVTIAVILLCYLAELCRKEGQLRKAHALYLEALERATGEHGRRWPVAGRALVGLGEIEREWNDLDSAAARLAEGIELILRGGQLGALEGYLELARVRQAQAKPEEALVAIQKARQLARQSDLSSLNDIAIDLFQATLWLWQGNLAEARRWAERRGLDKDVQPAEIDQRDDFVKYHFRKYEYAAAARLWLADGRTGEALALLNQAAPRVEKFKRPALAIEMHLLRAMAFQAQGQAEMALSALEHALELAEPEGYVRLFVDEGEPLRLLILDCRFSIEKTHPNFKNYVAELLAAFAGTGKSELGSSGPSKIQILKSKILLESLSDRELEVLRLLATSLSAAEIADELGVAVSTVRSHTKNIYGKLGVNGRLAAVEQAKALGLL